MKIYFLIDNKNFDDFDDYVDRAHEKWVGQEIFNQLVDGSWRAKYYAKGGLKFETTYYSLQEVNKELQERNNESFFYWSIVCIADVPDDYMIPNGIYARENNYNRIVAPLPDYSSLSLHFHRQRNA